MTRLSTVTCPACGHTGKPRVHGEGPVLLAFLPVVGHAIAAKDLAMAKLHCLKCDEPFTRFSVRKGLGESSRRNEHGEIGGRGIEGPAGSITPPFPRLPVRS
jgi:hypothetical protein